MVYVINQGGCVSCGRVSTAVARGSGGMLPPPPIKNDGKIVHKHLIVSS